VRRAGGHQVNLKDAAIGLAVTWDRDGWGPYEPAIRRWERVLGRKAPFPCERGKAGQLRLSAEFAEWLMGLPEGWVTGIAGLPYSARIRATGNGVVPHQAAAALRLLIVSVAAPGAPRLAGLTGAPELGLDAGGPGRKASRACLRAAPSVDGGSAPTAAARAPQRRAEARTGTPPPASADAPGNTWRAA
jgi:DNA (cytosine-5)-methyltransferase 1